MQRQVDRFLADATPYLWLFSHVAIGWMWFRQAVIAARALEASPAAGDAAFYRAKLRAARFFFAYELPKTEGLATTLLGSEGLTLAAVTEDDVFVD